MEAFLKDENGKNLIRYSAIVAALKADGDSDSTEILSRLSDEIREAGMTCPDHGLLDDPILGIGDLDGLRLCVACPWCSGEAVLKLWQEQAPKE